MIVLVCSALLLGVLYVAAVIADIWPDRSVRELRRNHRHLGALRRTCTQGDSRGR